MTFSIIGVFSCESISLKYLRIKLISDYLVL